MKIHCLFCTFLIEAVLHITSGVGIEFFKQLSIVTFKTLRPHPERLKLEEDSESDNSDEAPKEAQVKKYVPPKVMAVYYNGNALKVFRMKIFLNFFATEN